MIRKIEEMFSSKDETDWFKTKTDKYLKKSDFRSYGSIQLEERLKQSSKNSDLDPKKYYYYKKYQKPYYTEILDFECLKFKKVNVRQKVEGLMSLYQDQKKVGKLKLQSLDYNPLDPVKVVLRSFVTFLNENLEDDNKDELEFAAVDSIRLIQKLETFLEKDGGDFAACELLLVLQTVANIICGEDDANSLKELSADKIFGFYGESAVVVQHTVKSGDNQVEASEGEGEIGLDRFYLDFSFNEWLSFCGEVRYSSQPQNRQRLPNLATVVAKVFERFDPSIQKQELLGKDLIIFPDSLYSDSKKLIQPWTDLTQIPPRQHLKAFLINREDFEGSNKLKFRIKVIPTYRTFPLRPDSFLVDTVIPVDLFATVDEFMDNILALLEEEFKSEIYPAEGIVKEVLLLNHYRKTATRTSLQKTRKSGDRELSKGSENPFAVKQNLTTLFSQIPRIENVQPYTLKWEVEGFNESSIYEIITSRGIEIDNDAVYNCIVQVDTLKQVMKFSNSSGRLTSGLIPKVKILENAVVSPGAVLDSVDQEGTGGTVQKPFSVVDEGGIIGGRGAWSAAFLKDARKKDFKDYFRLKDFKQCEWIFRKFEQSEKSSNRELLIRPEKLFRSVVSFSLDLVEKIDDENTLNLVKAIKDQILSKREGDDEDDEETPKNIIVSLQPEETEKASASPVSKVNLPLKFSIEGSESKYRLRASIGTENGKLVSYRYSYERDYLADDDENEDQDTKDGSKEEMSDDEDEELKQQKNRFYKFLKKAAVRDYEINSRLMRGRKELDLREGELVMVTSFDACGVVSRKFIQDRSGFLDGCFSIALYTDTEKD